jgi:hypothetical protein
VLWVPASVDMVNVLHRVLRFTQWSLVPPPRSQPCDSPAVSKTSGQVSAASAARLQQKHPWFGGAGRGWEAYNLLQAGIEPSVEVSLEALDGRPKRQKLVLEFPQLVLESLNGHKRSQCTDHLLCALAAPHVSILAVPVT